jgi:hypothetical protein
MFHFNTIIFSVILLFAILSAEESQIPKNKNHNEEIIISKESSKQEQVITHEKTFLWKEQEGTDGSQLNGYLDEEKVATANKVLQKGIYEMIFIFIEDQRIASIIVSKKNDTYTHNLAFENTNGYKISITFEESDSASIVRINNTKDELIRVIKIDAKSNLIKVGPRHKDIPW